MRSGLLSLSPQGNARRAAMRAELIAAVDARRRRGHARRIAVLAALVVAGLVLLRGRHRMPDRAHSTITIVHDDPRILEAALVRTRPIPPGWLLDDDQMLDLLARWHRPSGLIRIGRRVLVRPNVVDE